MCVECFCLCLWPGKTQKRNNSLESEVFIESVVWIWSFKKLQSSLFYSSQFLFLLFGQPRLQATFWGFISILKLPCWVFLKTKRYLCVSHPKQTGWIELMHTLFHWNVLNRAMFMFISLQLSFSRPFSRQLSISWQTWNWWQECVFGCPCETMKSHIFLVLRLDWLLEKWTPDNEGHTFNYPTCGTNKGGKVKSIIYSCLITTANVLLEYGPVTPQLFQSSCSVIGKSDSDSAIILAEFHV